MIVGTSGRDVIIAFAGNDVIRGKGGSDVICAGAGAYSVAKIVETDGVWLLSEEQTPEGIAANWEAITSPAGEAQPQAGFEQTVKFTGKAMEGLGLTQG